MFAGNAIVVKTSEQTAWSSAYFLNIVRSALAACGHDPNLVHAISCWPQTASYFAGHQDISHLTFIGSKPVAHEVAKSASKSLTPLCVELGGKDAALILDEPNNQPETPDEIQRVLSILMRGIFQSAGQNCIGIERVVAMPQAHSRLSPLLASRIKRLRVGCDLDKQSDAKAVDVGAMISSASFDRLERLIDEAVAQGAKLVAGGRRFQHEKYPSAHYFEPTMLTDVTETMRIAQEELFAPICLLMQAETVTDAIRIANATNYGLACCVFGPTSSSKARTRLEEVVSAMKTGMVAVNDFAVTYPVQLPFGGVKASGYGRFAGEEGLRSLCNLKSVCSDRWPFAIKTTIPRALDYPMGPYASHAARGVVELGYGQGLKRKFDGIKAVLWYSSGS